MFPELGKSPKAKGFEKTILSLEADRKLIDEIGGQVRRRACRDMETLKKRLHLYVSAVVSHNANEESLTFGYWSTTEVLSLN